MTRPSTPGAAAAVSKTRTRSRVRRLTAMSFGLLFGLLLVLARPGVALADQGRAVGWNVESATRAQLIGRVELRYDPALETQAQWVAERIPGWWDDIEQKLGQDVDDSLTIHFVTHAGRVADATGMPYWAAGVANPPRGEIIFAQHRPDGSRADLESLLRHEMVHVALHRATNGAKVPAWFHEGVADSVGDEISLFRAETMATAVFGTGVPALDKLSRNFRGERQQVMVAYAASRDFATFLRYHDAGKDEASTGAAFRALISGLGHGKQFDAAVVKAYGVSLGELDRQWRGGLFGRFAWYPLLGSGGLPFILVMPIVAIAWVKRRKERAEDWARLEREEQLQHAMRLRALSGASA